MTTSDLLPIMTISNLLSYNENFQNRMRISNLLAQNDTILEDLLEGLVTWHLDPNDCLDPVQNLRLLTSVFVL